MKRFILAMIVCIAFLLTWIGCSGPSCNVQIGPDTKPTTGHKFHKTDQDDDDSGLQDDDDLTNDDIDDDEDDDNDVADDDDTGPDDDTAPPKNYCLSFDGENDYLDIAVGNWFNNTSFTVEFWLYPPQQEINLQKILAGSYGTSFHNLGIELGSDEYPDQGFVQAGFYNGTYRSYVYGTTRITGMDEFVHVAITYSITTQDMSIFINGQLDAQETMDFGTGAGGDEFIAAAGHPIVPTDYYTKCMIDEIRFSSVVRYTNNFTPQEKFDVDSDTIALYHLDEGKGAKTSDATGHHNPANLKNGVLWVER